MKHKIFLILFTVLLFLFHGTKITHAADQMDNIELNNQIQLLTEKIKYLQSLIANLKLQKEVSAESYLVMDISNNSVILQKDINQAYPIASVTKLMNAVITAENMDNNQSITLTEEMLKPLGYSPSLFLNLSVTVKNLLKASLIQSTNDAAESLSYFIGNKKFLDLMNQKVKELDMQNTHFYDVHGLNPNNHSTATDLAKLLAYINKNHPELWGITKDNDFWLPDPTGKLLKFKNVNNFYELPEFIGGKTGYLPEAKQSLASVFDLNGKPVAIILLRSKNRQTDVIKIINWIKSN
ncbi:MAG: serine hydrolase [Candidatus Staskawiczbacteria bacterium]|nr:serine hydrolase [Candidatus Staskawiczbacteria bacterium]